MEINSESKSQVHRIVVENRAKTLKEGSKILDAGAGPCPYKSMFKHCNYEAADFNNQFKLMDFTCSLEKIPRKDNHYDAILSTEVLEHVEYPQKVLGEFNRVLNKGGKLFLTVPQGWQIHQEPYNFFNFTRYGLESLLRNAGFRRYKITPKGGYFWFLADAIRFNGLLEQCRKYPFLYYPLRLIEFPITNILLPLLLFPFDKLDKQKKWTLGYVVEAVK